ncbi:NADH:ubiquinone oxidoreductase subunit J [Paenibacillus sp. J31TS4]|uniref:NADH-quinone oxidoreductase subunit J n=1 Tax=Paenibacillus sp. J31TS4 TaxID=2807195 RepID=UPI001B07A103|nr:NADH-quinone oxidoreductase subunit J [Paenibacillus sp. J31TS4]GIP40950.1 NADH:ubiquinone oxidoreductase subunit J [Paenibacillus sp. J31TS4]
MLSNLASFFSSGANLVFFVFALLTIGGAVFMLSFTKVVHMVLSLAFTFISLAGLYVLLEAEFVAFVQILIYAGAVTILMIFGIMMTKHRDGQGEEAPKKPVHNLLLGIGVLCLFGILFYGIQTSTFPGTTEPLAEDNSLEIGKLLFNRYVIPFELMSVLLTVAFIGAIVVAKREED